MGKFQIKKLSKLAEMKVGEEIPESDFATLTPEGVFVQLEYKEDETEIKTFDVKPGLFRINKTMSGMTLEKTSFVKDEILTSFVSTKEITDKIDCFFNRIHIYKKHGIEVPRRNILLYGPPGCGKTTSISIAAEKYAVDEKTLILIWHTDKFEPYQVKDFIRSFNYKHVERMILISEDIGGVEMDQVRMKSDSSLLSLLDNQEKTFKIPTMIIATTNHPEVFLGNMMNRPGRFHDKVSVDYPKSEFRVELFKFFAKEDASKATDEVLELIGNDKCKEFSADHLRDIIIRSDLYDKDYKMVINEMLKELELFKNMFQKGRSMGIGFNSSDDND